MKKINSSKVIMAIAIIFTFVSCNKNSDKNIISPQPKGVVLKEMMSENGTNPDEVAVKNESANLTNAGITKSESATDNKNKHFLYTESNGAGSNEILAYKINPNGTLNLHKTITSGGSGTGKGLGSQGALVLTKDHEWLFAVNAGSNSVSSFKVNNDGSLTLAHTESSGGTNPNSVSVYGDLLYVLNHGSDNIHGFRIGAGGTLASIPESTQPLSTTGTDAPQILFTPDGHWVIVTEKVTNKINAFKVKNDGSVWPAVVTASTGPTPFGFDFARDHFMIVSNAAGGAPGAGSATSYTIDNNGVPNAVNGAVPDNQAAPCWIAITQYGRFAFTTNTADNSISSYYVAAGGDLYLAQKVAASTDNGPVDIVVAKNNYNVYELNGKAGTIGEYHRTLDGGLEYVDAVSGLPAAVTGLATF